MKLVFKVAATLGVLTLFACAAVQIHSAQEFRANPIRMTQTEAKQAMIDLLSRNAWSETWSIVSLNVEEAGVHFRIHDNAGDVADRDEYLSFDNEMDIYSQDTQNFYTRYSISLSEKGASCWICSWKDEQSAVQFANVFYALKNARSMRSAPVDQRSVEQFHKLAQDYQKAKVKPALPEEVHKIGVQAADAAAHQRYDDAIAMYEKGFMIAPWWPEGHYNAALVYGTQERYGAAITEMKKYLELVPDGPNSRKAQDKIYLWEGRMGK